MVGHTSINTAGDFHDDIVMLGVGSGIFASLSIVFKEGIEVDGAWLVSQNLSSQEDEEQGEDEAEHFDFEQLECGFWAGDSEMKWDEERENDVLRVTFYTLFAVL